jgi:membrane associated rhomboid family serine protease
MTRIDWRETAMARTVNLRRRLLRQAIVLGSFVGVLWLLEILDALFLRGVLDGFGIAPRTLTSLPAVLAAPFLHAGFGHLMANTIPFVVLGWMVMWRRTSDLFVVFLASAVASGLGVWLFGGAHTLHLGLSGVIFGFFGFLLARGYYERSAGAIGVALVAFLLYGGILWGVLPLQQGVSWQGHLFGFVGGVVTAYVMARAQTMKPATALATNSQTAQTGQSMRDPAQDATLRVP